MCCCPACHQDISAPSHCWGSTSLESSGTHRALQTSLNAQEQRKLPAPWPHACSRSGQKGVRPWLQESPWVLQQQARPGPLSYIHYQGRSSSCAFCIPLPGLITSRKSALEKTRIEVVEPPQSHQSLKSPSWAQPPLHPSRSRVRGSALGWKTGHSPLIASLDLAFSESRALWHLPPTPRRGGCNGRCCGQRAEQD